NGIEVPFFIWLLAGFFLWIFSFQSMIEGSKSIYTRLKMLSKMSFPFSVIPNFVIFSKFYIHIFMLAITIIILQFNVFYISIYYYRFSYVFNIMYLSASIFMRFMMAFFHFI